MNEVELSDGTVITLSGSETPEQLTQLKQKVADYEYKLSSGDQGFVGNVSSDWQQRQRDIDVSQQEYEAGRQTLPEYALQGLGSAAGSFGDLVGRGIGEAGQLVSRAIPSFVEEGAKDIATAAGETSLAERAKKVLRAGGQAYSDISEEYPRATRNVEAATNLALLGAPAFGRSAQITGSIERGGKAIADKFKPDPKTLSSEDLKSIGGDLFKYADDKGGILKPEVTNKFIDDISKELPQTDAGLTLQGETPTSKMLMRAQNLRDKPLTLESAKEIDEILGELAYKNVNPFGELDKEGRKFVNMQSSFRESIENASDDMVEGGKEGYEALKDARKYWSTSLRLRDIEKIIQKGSMAEQPATSIKNGFKTLLGSKKIKGFSPEEVQAIRLAADKGILTDLVGTFGSRLSPQILGVGVGVGTGNPLLGAAAGIANYATAAGARGFATKRQLNRAKFVEDLIRQRVGEFGKQKFKITPEINTLLQEAGIIALPSANASALLDEIKKIQELPVQEEDK